MALALLTPDGVLVVHDCHPTSPEVASPQYKQDKWLGLTYLAFLDLMRERPELDYWVVDVDHGCGVVQRRPAGAAGPPNRSLLDACNYHDWPVYFAHRKELLRLVGIEDFLAAQRVNAPTWAASASKTLRALRHRNSQ